MATGILGQQDVAGTTYTNLYQCPADTFTVATVSLCNRTASAINVRIAITGTAPPSAPSNSEFVEYDVSLSGNGVLERTGLVLQAGKYIAVYASTTGISANAYGIETATV